MKIEFNKKQVEVEEVECELLEDKWIEYKVEDVIIRVKPVVVSVLKLIGELDETTQLQQYLVKTQDIITVKRPSK